MNDPKLTHLSDALADVLESPTLAEQGLKVLDDAYAASQPAVVTDVLGTTADWFVATGQMPEAAEPNARQAAFYVGMQLEELAEKLALIMGSDAPYVTGMETLATAFKRGTMDEQTALALQRYPVTLLDADMDLIWVSIGGARAQGADVIGAYSAVNHANWDKRNPDTGLFDRDPATGKVIKRAGWQEADLTPYIHDTLRK